MLARLTNIQGHQYHNITNHQYHKYITKTHCLLKEFMPNTFQWECVPLQRPLLLTYHKFWAHIKTGHNYFHRVLEIQTLDGFSTFLTGGKVTDPCIFQFLCLHSHVPFFHLENWTSYLGYNIVFYLPNCLHIPYMKDLYDRMDYAPG